MGHLDRADERVQYSVPREPWYRQQQAPADYRQSDACKAGRVDPLQFQSEVGAESHGVESLNQEIRVQDYRSGFVGRRLIGGQTESHERQHGAAEEQDGWYNQFEEPE